MALKEFRQLRRDHRTVAMMVVLPLVLLVVFGYAASFDVSSIRTIVYGPDATVIAAALPTLLDVRETRVAGDRAAATDALRRGEATLAIVSDATGHVQAILVDGADLFGARAALAAMSRAAAAAGAAAGAAGPASGAPAGPMVSLPAPEILFNPDLRTSAVMVPALAGMILIFVGTVATSLGVVRERQAGTLEQLAVMPFRPRDVFIGKVLPYFAVAALDMTVVVLAGLIIFGVPFRGSVLTFALGAGLFLFVTSGIGILISTVSENQGQAIQLAIMTLLPQVLLSGMIFPLDSMAAGVRWIGYLLPLTYFTQISRGVLLRGAPIDALAVPIGALAIMGTLVFGLSIVRFRRDLAPGGRGSGRTEQAQVGPAEPAA
jgi:ABC-2 type transport system permease protein